MLKLEPLIKNKPIQETTVVVAMSGGVDSSTVAAALHKMGYKVIGITLQLYNGDAKVRKGACCAGQDIYDAKRVAHTFGFPHYVLNYESLFKQEVIDDFADTYLKGQTPIPCVRCNQTVKFRDLLKVAHALKADALATGHYVRRCINNNQVELHTAKDISKDQSYFLFATTMEQLAFLRFPLGEIMKEETREIAHALGIAIADKADSQDICFVGGGSYASIVQKLRPQSLKTGNIIDINGKVLGQHQGIINYTVGQRRGLGIASSQPLYVIKIKPATNEVIIGPKSALLENVVFIDNINWISNTEITHNQKVQVKLRSGQAAVNATIKVDDRVSVSLDNSQAGIAPGQACVIYNNTRILGGGWIVNSEKLDNKDFRWYNNH